MTPVIWQRVEGTVIAAAAFVGVLLLDFPFWLPFALFLAFDLSALGYLFNPRVGAWGYNLVHNYAGAAIVGVIAAGQAPRLEALDDQEFLEVILAGLAPYATGSG